MMGRENKTYSKPIPRSTVEATKKQGNITKQPDIRRRPPCTNWSWKLKTRQWEENWGPYD